MGSGGPRPGRAPARGYSGPVWISLRNLTSGYISHKKEESELCAYCYGIGLNGRKENMHPSTRKGQRCFLLIFFFDLDHALCIA